MSSHHGHHRSSHHSRSRAHHSSSHYQSSMSRSRTSNSNMSSGGGERNMSTSSSGGRGNQHHHQQISDRQTNESNDCDWSEHRSSSGKVYYYNTRTGVSQWEIPAELKRYQQQQQQQIHQQQHQHLQHQQQQHHHHNQQQQQINRNSSPESVISESSSIRQQQDKSPSSSASSNKSSHSDSLLEDKPLLTPSLAQYFKPELIVNFKSSQLDEFEKQANQYASDALLLSERILKGSVDLKIAKAVAHYYDISLEVHEKKCNILKETIDKIKLT